MNRIARIQVTIGFWPHPSQTAIQYIREDVPAKKSLHGGVVVSAQLSSFHRWRRSRDNLRSTRDQQNTVPAITSFPIDFCVDVGSLPQLCMGLTGTADQNLNSSWGAMQTLSGWLWHCRLSHRTSCRWPLRLGASRLLIFQRDQQNLRTQFWFSVWTRSTVLFSYYKITSIFVQPLSLD